MTLDDLGSVTTQTQHQFTVDDSRQIDLPAESVALVATSPPYPMIEMWDELFATLNPEIAEILLGGDGDRAFDLMHAELDMVWTHLHRVLKPGGMACINIGEATRTLSNDFRLYPNQARVVQHLNALGFHSLPKIIWHKPTNAPTKFMGSGMLPPGAYVTNEHEYILIVRKGSKREFTEDQKRIRRYSGYFYEERNDWFSDVWTDLKGADQQLCMTDTRSRSAAFPFELAYRLINMYSIKGDTVLDPFSGTGTTIKACMAAGRNSIGYEIDESLVENFRPDKDDFVAFANRYLNDRITRHLDFVQQHDGSLKYSNNSHGFPVKSDQEMQIILNGIRRIRKENDGFIVTYGDSPNLEPAGSQLSLDELLA